MAKFSTEFTEQFQHAEPVEEDGVVLAHLRVGSVKIRRNGKHVSTISVGVKMPTDASDDPLSLVLVLTPADDDLGYRAEKSLEVQGDAAKALVDLLGRAAPFLEGKSDGAKKADPRLYLNIFGQSGMADHD